MCRTLASNYGSLVLYGASFLVLGCFPKWALAEDVSADRIGFLREAYLHNRELFAFLDCSFVVESGYAESVEQVLAGGRLGRPWMQPVRHEWLVNGDKVRYDMKCDESDLKRNEAAMEQVRGNLTGEVQHVALPVPCLNEMRLRNRDYALLYDPQGQFANLERSEFVGGAGIRLTPFNFHVFGADESADPAFYLRWALEERLGCVTAGNKRVGGRDLPVLAFQLKESGERGLVVPELAFDPDAGYLCRYVALRDSVTNEVSASVYVVDAKPCSNGGWFPATVVRVNNPDKEGPVRAQRLTVTHLDVADPPDPSKFRLDLPPQTLVSMPSTTEWVRPAYRISVTPDDLAALHERMAAHTAAYNAEPAGRMPADSAAETAASLMRYLVGVNLGVALLLLIAFMLRRRSRYGVTTRGNQP